MVLPGAGRPAADPRDEVAAASGVPEPADKIWFHKTAAAVIEPDRCVGCGGCIAACPSGSISVASDGKPTLTKMCTGCSACWDYCPLGGLRMESLGRALGDGAGGLGSVRDAWSARANDRAEGAQDGGVVTALLAALLERGEIDGAILTRRAGAFRGEAFLATTPEEVRSGAGSVYHQSYALEVLARPLPAGISRLAFVGTPCQVGTLRALQRFPWRYRRSAAGAVQLAVGLFCTRSFDPARLMGALASRGVALAGAARIEVRAGVLTVFDRAGAPTAAFPAKEFRDAALKGCDECADFSAHLADIAVGSEGSTEGFTTVLIRTQAAADAWEAAADALASSPLADLGPVERTEGRNRARAERNLHRSLDSEAPLWITYSEHLAAYSGTDRAPVQPPPHRSHHYQQSC